MNRRIVALSLSLVGALIAAGCGGSDNSTRTRNMDPSAVDPASLMPVESISVVCYDDAGRSVDSAATKAQWDKKIEDLEADLARAEAIEIPPTLIFGGPPREEYASDDAYNQAVADAQTAYADARAFEDAQSKSKTERIASITADLAEARKLRDAELARIAEAPACIGDPGTGEAGGTSSNLSIAAEPCANATAADLVGSSGSQTLRIRICDGATKLSLQSYDVSYNSLASSEQVLSEGTGRYVEKTISTEVTGFKAVTCSAIGYIDSSIITVNGQNVTTESLYESDQPIVAEFCGTAPTNSGTGNGASSGTSNGDVTTAGTSNSLPLNENGSIDASYITSLLENCSASETRPSRLEVKETLFKDNVFTEGEPLVVTATLPCIVTTPELEHVGFYVAIYEGEIMRWGANSREDEVTFTKTAPFLAREGEWQLIGNFTLEFALPSGSGQGITIQTEPFSLNVGPANNDPDACKLESFVMSKPVDGVKTITAACDSIRYDLRGVSSTPEGLSGALVAVGGDASKLEPSPPAKHKVGSGVGAHVFFPWATLGHPMYYMLSCDDDCVSKQSTVANLTRSGSEVTLSVSDSCADKGEGYHRITQSGPLVQLQPDLLGYMEDFRNLEGKYLAHDSLENDATNAKRSTMTTSADWFLVVTGCEFLQGDDDTSPFTEFNLVKVPGGTATKDQQLAETTASSDPRAETTSLPLSEALSNGAVSVSPEVTTLSLSLLDLGNLADLLQLDAAQLFVAFDNGSKVTVPTFGRRSIDVPSDARVLRVTAVDSQGQTKVIELPVQNSEPAAVITSDGTISSTQSTESDSPPWLWIVVALVVVLATVTVVLRKRRTVAVNAGSDSAV